MKPTNENTSGSALGESDILAAASALRDLNRPLLSKLLVRQGELGLLRERGYDKGGVYLGELAAGIDGIVAVATYQDGTMEIIRVDGTGWRVVRLR